jgi:hypothetical protein
LLQHPYYPQKSSARIAEGLTTTEQQILELWSATTAETDDFAIDHGSLQQNHGLRREKLIQSLIAA